MKQKVAVVRKRYRAAGQAHVLEGLGEGTVEERAGMVEQLLEVDLEGLQEAVGEALGRG